MDEIAKKMAELAERFGPQVIDAARGATVVEAYSSMMSSAICLLVCAALTFGGRTLWAKRDVDDEFDGYRVVSCIVWAVAAILVIPGAWGFLDPWVWTAINHPDLWIAKKVLHI